MFLEITGASQCLLTGWCAHISTDVREPRTLSQRKVEYLTFLERIKHLREVRFTIVIIDHRMNVVMRLCDRVVVLSFGREIVEGRPPVIQRDPGGQRCVPWSRMRIEER